MFFGKAFSSLVFSFEKRLIISICSSIFMSSDNKIAPEDAVGDALQVYDLVVEKTDR